MFIGIILGAVIVYLILRPKLIAVKEYDEQIEKRNYILREENEFLEGQKENIRLNIINVEQQLTDTNFKKDKANKEYLDILDSIRTKENELNKMASNLQDRFDIQVEKIRQKYLEDEDKYREEYLASLAEYNQEFQNITAQKQLELSILEQQFNDLSALTNAAVEANKRKQEIEENDKFYRLVLSDIDLQEIKKLREVATYLRNTEPLNKVIWKVYYENPTTALIGRVVGAKQITGIYKITNLSNGMCYIGQSASISERFKQHIKRGLGAETPTRNKLYPAMAEYGVENFSFEIIEECPREKLNEREDFWQEYFKAKTFGYSIK